MVYCGSFLIEGWVQWGDTVWQKKQFVTPSSIVLYLPDKSIYNVLMFYSPIFEEKENSTASSQGRGHIKYNALSYLYHLFMLM